MSHSSGSERDESRIRAIETHYAGHRFRSRLEARWAVFFDALGMPWEYEAEGYETSGGRYLPDFWLPEASVWAEVKGQLSHQDLAKVTDAIFEMREPPGVNILPQLVFLGPIPRPGSAWAHIELGILGDNVLWQQVFLAEFGAHWFFKPIARAVVFKKGSLGRASEDLTQFFRDGALNPASDDRLIVDPTVDEAYRAARSARFEFGESGA